MGEGGVQPGRLFVGVYIQTQLEMHGFPRIPYLEAGVWVLPMHLCIPVYIRCLAPADVCVCTGERRGPRAPLSADRPAPLRSPSGQSRHVPPRFHYVPSVSYVRTYDACMRIADGPSPSSAQLKENADAAAALSNATERGGRAARVKERERDGDLERARQTERNWLSREQERRRTGLV